jgi:formate hydrogenlyase subunit 3/multisubunit Na+/H+ antiporter MnhD subunit
VNGPFLTLLAAILAALTGLGVIGAAWPRRAHEAVGFGATSLTGLAALLSLLALLLDDPPAMLALPLGLPGAAFRLGLDPLAAFFAALVFAAGTAACAFAAATDSAAQADPASVSAHLPGAAQGHAPDAAAHISAAHISAAHIPAAHIPAAAPLPVCIAGLGLAVLATDAPARAAGLALAGGALWAMGATSRAGATQLAITLLAAAAIVIAGSAPAPALLWLALLGPGALAGLVPLHAWLTQPHQTPTPAVALLSGGMVPVAIYAILRMLFDPAGAVPPAWWGALPMLLGAASVIAGGLDATDRPDLDTAIAAGTVRQTGLTAIGLGIALTARAADLPAVTAIALGAVLLLAALQAICGTLLPLAAGAIRYGAGTRQLDRLGGLIHRMPTTTACLLAGLFGLAALPPGPGFAALWLLFQALLALPRAGALPFQLLLCALAAVLGLGAALAAASLLRLVGIACLGRPRTPRAAVADEPPRPARRALLTLAATSVAIGVFVGPFLRFLADAPIRDLTGTGLGARATLLGLAPGAESPGYAALPLTSLLLLAAGLVLWLRRLRGVPAGAVSGPAWDGGFAAPPAWLPFGNPVTQSSGAGFAPSPACGTLFRRLIPLRARIPMPKIQVPRRSIPAPAVVLILVAAFLALWAWAGAT